MAAIRFSVPGGHPVLVDIGPSSPLPLYLARRLARELARTDNRATLKPLVRPDAMQEAGAR